MRERTCVCLRIREGVRQRLERDVSERDERERDWREMSGKDV
jgi:hypothetical protein